MIIKLATPSKLYILRVKGADVQYIGKSDPEGEQLWDKLLEVAYPKEAEVYVNTQFEEEGMTKLTSRELTEMLK